MSRAVGALTNKEELHFLDGRLLEKATRLLPEDVETELLMMLGEEACAGDCVQFHLATREAQKAFILGLQRALRLLGAKVAEDVAVPVDMFPHMSPEPEAKGSGGTGQMGEAGAVYAPVDTATKNLVGREHLLACVAAVDEALAVCSKEERPNPQEPESFVGIAEKIVAMAEDDPFWDGEEIWV